MYEAEILPYNPGSKASGYEWTKVPPEAKDRTYTYPGGHEFEVKGVIWISVKKNSAGHSHRLYTSKLESVYMPAGWLSLRWLGKFEF